MLDAIRDRYGVWTARALLEVTRGAGRVTWPDRGEYDTDLGLFVGPDGRRWRRFLGEIVATVPPGG